jgi:transposase-like protein
MGRRFYTREYKLEAIKPVKERGVSLLQAAQRMGPREVTNSQKKILSWGFKSYF